MAANTVFGTPLPDAIQTSLIAPTVIGGDWEVFGFGADDSIVLDTVPPTPDVAFGGGGNDKILGNTAPNRLFGDDAQGIFSGPAGKDTIFGGNELTATGTGGDFIDGQDGSDALFGEGGNDIVVGGNGNDKVDGGTGDDILEGNAGDDRLIGGKGADFMTGDLGDDTLYGGKGADIMTGGLGLDIFVYTKTNEGVDTITDFVSGIDLIQLDKSVFGLTSPPGVGLNAADFGVFVGVAAADASGAKVAIVANVMYYNASGAGGDLVALATFSAGIPLNPFTDYVIVP